jgi:hypothetical protein
LGYIVVISRMGKPMGKVTLCWLVEKKNMKGIGRMGHYFGGKFSPMNLSMRDSLKMGHLMAKEYSNCIRVR